MHVLLKGNKKQLYVSKWPRPGGRQTQITAPRQAFSMSSSKASSGSWPLSPLGAQPATAAVAGAVVFLLYSARLQLATWAARGDGLQPGH